jgi:hypothetical protein
MILRCLARKSSTGALETLPADGEINNSINQKVEN